MPTTRGDVNGVPRQAIDFVGAVNRRENYSREALPEKNGRNSVGRS
jgi:hypothetical protein